MLCSFQEISKRLFQGWVDYGVKKLHILEAPWICSYQEEGDEPAHDAVCLLMPIVRTECWKWGNDACFIIIWVQTVAAATVIIRLRACDDRLNEILAVNA